MDKPTDIDTYRTEKIYRGRSPIEYIDDYGVRWTKWLVSYWDNMGRQMTIELWAQNQMDAQQRMTAIATGIVEGELHQETSLS